MTVLASLAKALRFLRFGICAACAQNRHSQCSGSGSCWCYCQA